MSIAPADVFRKTSVTNHDRPPYPNDRMQGIVIINDFTLIAGEIQGIPVGGFQLSTEAEAGKSDSLKQLKL